MSINKAVLCFTGGHVRCLCSLGVIAMAVHGAMRHWCTESILISNKLYQSRSLFFIYVVLFNMPRFIQTAHSHTICPYLFCYHTHHIPYHCSTALTAHVLSSLLFHAYVDENISEMFCIGRDMICFNLF